MSSSRSKKAQALSKIKAARTTGGRSALDEYDAAAADEDIYDYLPEEDYQHLVESRRQREDFVVDDDGIGYYDDGEERFGDEQQDDDDHHSKRKAVGAPASLTAKALKKARKSKQQLLQQQPQQPVNANSNRSMWDFVSRGRTTEAPSKAKPATTAATNNSYFSTAPLPNVNDLLAQLDDPLVHQQQQQRTSSSRHSFSRRRGRSAPQRRGSSSGQRGPPVRLREEEHNKSDQAVAQPAASNQRVAGDELAQDDDGDDDDFGGGMAFDDDDDDDDNNDRDPPRDEPVQSEGHETTSASSSPQRTTKTVTFAGDSKPASTTCDPPDDSVNNNEPTVDRPRRRIARPKLGQLSAPAQKAAEQAAAAAAAKAPAPSSSGTTMTPMVQVDTTSASFQPCTIATAADTSNRTTLHTTANQLPLDQFVQTTLADNDDTFMDFYWMDVCERQGDILLFGKVPVPNQPNKFVSAAVLVTGNVHNLFVLPREKKEPEEKADHSDGSNDDATTTTTTRANMMDVHAEITTLLQKILPRQTGTSWAGKVVQRQYAFDDPTIPRTPTDYLKVIYSTKFPLPSPEVATTTGGTHFAQILGTTASVRENFIVKRKLMGPCWVRIRNPEPTAAPVSWCQVECGIRNPKQLVRWDLAQQQQRNNNHENESDNNTGNHNNNNNTAVMACKPPPPPPVVTMSIKLKTVVNPKTHKSEIVSLSAVCHTKVLLDSASDESHKHMTQLSLIRPLQHPQQTTAQFPRDLAHEIARHMPQLQTEPNERAMLNRLFAQIEQWDPDIIVGHNAWGYDMQVLLQRCTDLKLNMWSKLGRRRRMQMPSSSKYNKDLAIADAVAGRLLCDTYLSAKELLRETTYSLTNLAATQLKTNRQEIEPVDIPQWFNTSKTIVQLAMSTLFDAQLVQRLLFKLQILPLSKQLTCIAGNIWSHTLKSNRAERTEYLLLHEFHRLKYLPPEKKRSKPLRLTGEKAKYSGGLVLEPKKGLYDSFILLLDFNSLYPSLIQEYNLCFTTIDWSRWAVSPKQQPDGGESSLPATPDPSVPPGVLPRVIKSLVDRRKNVKKMLKSETNPDKKEELDIRQMALKLTANSMYGCLGFSNSRFFAQPLAALVTAKGRETLQRTVDIATNKVGLDVIYGDTDSIMINTRLNSETDLPQVKQLGERVKKEVNCLYKTLELEIDGIFRSMLLLKKKKYAARTVVELPNGEIKYGEEIKGLDLVRRDWCVQSKDTGRYVTSQILSGQESETVLENIHTHLEELATKMREGKLPIEKYVITKGLSKHPNDYPDAKSQPHVQVAKMMLQNNRPVNMGDHIPYIITAPLDEEPKSASAADRARHPEEVARSAGALKPDVEWYLLQQILPPISRLCEPIDRTSQQILALKLGLDATKYSHTTRSSADLDEEIKLDFTPASFLSDAERFKDVEKLQFYCFACHQVSEFPGVIHAVKDDSGAPALQSGLTCTNPHCIRPHFWGQANAFECSARLMNAMSIWVRNLSAKYYDGWVRCDEAGCGLETRQLSVAGAVCLRPGCNGRMCSVDTERDIHTHLTYLERTFSVEHACEQLEKQETFGRQVDILKGFHKHDLTALEMLHGKAKSHLASSAFNWIDASFWRTLFGSNTEKVKQ